LGELEDLGVYAVGVDDKVVVFRVTFHVERLNVEVALFVDAHN
jgi:hypothetical protein